MRSPSNSTTARTARQPLTLPEISLEARAERVLAEYLRQWGLRDPTTIAVHCRRWVRQAIERDAGASQQQPAAVYRFAVELAVADINRWLDHLATLGSANAQDAQARRGLLAIEVQMLIDKCPEALLKYDSLPAPLVQHLRRAARSAVPAAHPTRMQAQPLGQLASPFSWRWWLAGMSRMGSSAALALRLARAERGTA